MTFCPRPGKESETAYAEEALHLVYDCWGRVVQAWKDSGSGNAGSLVTTGGSADTQLEACCYDGLGRRIASNRLANTGRGRHAAGTGAK